MNNLVPVKELESGDTFFCPWRRYGSPAAGRVQRVGTLSVGVHVPRHEGDGWENTQWAPTTLISRCNPEYYYGQSFGKTGSGRVRNKSKIKKPTEVVWALCDEMFPNKEDGITTGMRDEMVARATEEGVNISTAKTQFYKWKKKHGL